MRRSRRSTVPWPSGFTTSGCVSPWVGKGSGGFACASLKASPLEVTGLKEHRAGEVLLPLQAYGVSC